MNWINTDRFIEFLRALIEDAQRKVFLIVDNLRVHHAKLVKAWLEDKEDRIEILYLPPYSPEANPEEILNRDLKTELRTRPAAKSASELKKIASDFMYKLALVPQRVVQYFISRHIAMQHKPSDDLYLTAVLINSRSFNATHVRSMPRLRKVLMPH